MKFIWSLIACFAIALIGVLGWLLWSANLNYVATASVEIKVPRERIFRQVAVLENWTLWSPFVPQNAPGVVLDPESDPPTLSWPDPRGGTAWLTLDSTDSVQGVVVHSLQSPIFPPLRGTLQLESGEPRNGAGVDAESADLGATPSGATDSDTGSQTDVVANPDAANPDAADPAAALPCRLSWRVEGTLPNTIFYRLMSGSYSESLSAQLQHSLERLKNRLEQSEE